MRASPPEQAARADDPVHDEPPGRILQLFGQILAGAAKGSAAMGTVIVAGGQFGLLARDVIGDGTPLRLVLLLFVRKTNICPANGSCFSTVSAWAASVVNPRRMSVTPAASHTRVFTGTGIRTGPGSAGPAPRDRGFR